MPAEVLGIGQTLILYLPETWQEWTLLLGYLLLFVVLLFRDRSSLQQFTLRKLIGWAILGVLALFAALFFPISFAPNIFPLSPEGESFSVSLLAAVPSLLAGLILGPAAALLVGMSAGLGRAISQSHQIYDLFHFAFAAWLAACLLRNRYRGRRYVALRMPVISGPLTQSTIAFMAGFVVFVLSAEWSLLSRFDLALAEVQRSIVPLFIEGLSGGLVVALILLVKPAWRNDQVLIPTPGQRSIQQYLRNNMILFGATVFLIVVTAAFFISTIFSTISVFNELAAQAYAATVGLTDFQPEMETSLLSFDGRDDLLDGNKVNNRALSRLAMDYDQVFFVDDEKNITPSFSSAESDNNLTDRELEAVSKTLEKGTKGLILDSGQDGEPGISVVVPVVGVSEDSGGALLGRVKKSSLTTRLRDLTKNNQPLSGAIVNLDGDPIVEVGVGESAWLDAVPLQIQSQFMLDDFGGSVLLGESGTGARQLIYIAPSGIRDWRVAVSTPYGLILRQGLVVAVSLGFGLLVVAGLFYVRMNNYARDLSRSISDLTRDSLIITDDVSLVPRGGIGRQDEVGELSRALDDMQRGLKKRLDEQSLLLSVSRESSTSFELSDSLPVVLHGALRGTGAAGVRGLVLNPGGGRPVSFSEGPAAENMQVFDTKLLSLMPQEEELILSSPRTIHDQLEISSAAELPVKALYVLPLQVEKKFLGFLAVGFRNQREFSENDLAFLQSLARQASIRVQKSYLYTYAEGGRKRLTAVLDSTSDPVVVTDPTARILRINRAMEQAFELEAQQVVGRKVADVIDSTALVNALTSEETESRDLEIMGKDDCTYFANTSLIISRERAALGRVAVLHDVTQLKVIDRLKTEFIDNVSHDLRTPLTVLSGYASALALVDDLTLEQREYTDNILHSVERMVELVEDLLDLGKIEAGVDQIFEDIEIGPLLRDLADENWLYAHEAGVRLRVRFADDLPAVCCDRVLVRRALSNLLMNGFKYAPNSGDITLAAELSEDGLLISVRDRGPGIAREDQLRLFEKFYRVNRHGDGAVKGTGLGLAMVRSIAERHGGRAWCKSAPGKGSTFYLSIPLEYQSASLT